MFQYETSECIDNLYANSNRPELDFCFVGPGDLAMSCGLHTRDAVLGMMKAVEMQWMYHEIVDKVTACGKIPGGFTRGGICFGGGGGGFAGSAVFLGGGMRGLPALGKRCRGRAAMGGNGGLGD